MDNSLPTQSEIEYELEVHDCGQNPYCNSYRSCGNDVKPIPSPKKLKIIKDLLVRKYTELGFDITSIEKFIKERYE